MCIEDEKENVEPRVSRMRALGGGMSRIMKKNPKYSYMNIEGIDNCIRVLNELKEGNIHHCFLELNACDGGCIGGPSFQTSKVCRLQSQLELEKASISDASNIENCKDFYNIGHQFN